MNRSIALLPMIEFSTTALAGLTALALLAGASDLIRPSPEAFNDNTESTTTHVDEPPRCEITVEGYHGGASDPITFNLGESQVRTRVGWWASLLAPGRQDSGAELLTMEPGNRFSETFDLRLGCKAHRRYRFHFSAGEALHTYTFPSGNAFTQQQVIDLGDVSRYFGWIEPGEGPIAEAPVEPGDSSSDVVSIGDASIDGEWIRRESNNDPNDGMRIEVRGDEAVLTYVPESSSSAWKVGEVLWRGIKADGTLDVLGNNNSYYPAHLATDGPSGLQLDVHYNGAGNDQTWERGEAAVAACAWNTPGTAAADGGVWTTASTSLPAALLETLREVKRAGTAIQTLALTPGGEWIVVADNVPCYSAGFPTGVREHVDRFIASGREIDVVAFGSGNQWIIIAEDWMRRANVPEAAADWVRRLQGEGRRISAFAFTPGGAAVAAGGEAFTFGSVPDGVAEAVAAARTSQRPIHDVAFGADGAWVLVAGSWFATGEAPIELFRNLHRYRTDENRRITHVLLDAQSEARRWTIVSNRREPAPTTDADQMERFMAPDSASSIWVRMRANDIRGLAMAVVENNKIAWARGYGVRGGNDHERYVYPTTVFDAASISKPVAAAGLLQLVDKGTLDLTQDGVLLDLAGSVVPPQNVPYLAALAPGVTLTRLLSHCAGLDHANGSSAAQTFAVGEEQPSLNQMIVGLGPADENKKVVRSGTPGVAYSYSGANFLLAQALIETHADGGFDAHMQRLLEDLEMFDSSYDSPRPDRSEYGYGYGCDGGGTCPVEGYANQAAASLTSTVTDLARFVIMLNQGGKYAGRQLLQTATVDRMLKRDGTAGASLVEQQCDTSRTSGLGMEIRKRGTDDEEYWHRGTHNGFRAYIYGFPQKDAGLILLMTGKGENATNLKNEIKPRFRAVHL